jgi:hypothetical protein
MQVSGQAAGSSASAESKLPEGARQNGALTEGSA